MSGNRQKTRLDNPGGYLYDIRIVFRTGGSALEFITSRQNPLVVRVRRLNASRAARREAGLFSAEGPKLLEEAIKAGVRLDTVITAQGAEIPCPKEGRWVEVPGDLLKSLCDTQTPQGVLFLAQMPDTTPPQRLEGGRWLVLDGLQDPGNVGTIWRTADALGADGLLLVNHCADPFSPKTVRATMGACFRLPVYETQADQLPALLERSGLPLYAAALREDTVDIRTAQLDRCAVAIGSEGRGVSPELLALSRATVKIPKIGRASCRERVSSAV